jgi:hypothetical protein
MCLQETREMPFGRLAIVSSVEKEEAQSYEHVIRISIA